MNKLSVLLGLVLLCGCSTESNYYIFRVPVNACGYDRANCLGGKPPPSASLASNLPPQKIVEVEKVVYEQAPFCEVVEEQIKAKAPIPLRHDGLSFCKELMYGGDNSNVRVPDLYDAINQWIEESDAPRGGIEDRIMSHVLLVLIDCFQKT